MLSYAEEQEARRNLEQAFRDLKWNHTFLASGRAELEYRGGSSSAARLLEKYRAEVDGLIRVIELEERACRDYLQRYCPEFYAAAANSRTVSWRKEDEVLEQEKAAEKRIEEALEKIDDDAERMDREVSQDFFAGLQESISNFSLLEQGRAWNAELRKRLASAAELKTEVNSLVELGLHSITNSKHVNLGDHFIRLLKDDPAMEEIISVMEEKIISEIKRSAYKVPYLSAQKLDRHFSGHAGSYGWGGKRHSDPMFTQLAESIFHPIDSASKYADTWKVALNQLTWSLRNASVVYTGNYHAVYNVCGFAFLWEMEFSIEDVLDLRPRSGGNINFGGKTPGEEAYNFVTSFFGTIYHDILGNTDELLVRAKWTACSEGNGGIYSW